MTSISLDQFDKDLIKDQTYLVLKVSTRNSIINYLNDISNYLISNQISSNTKNKLIQEKSNLISNLISLSTSLNSSNLSSKLTEDNSQQTKRRRIKREKFFDTNSDNQDKNVIDISLNLQTKIMNILSTNLSYVISNNNAIQIEFRNQMLIENNKLINLLINQPTRPIDQQRNEDLNNNQKSYEIIDDNSLNVVKGI